MRVQPLQVGPAVWPRHVLRPCPQYGSDWSSPRIIIVIQFAFHLFFKPGTPNLHPCYAERHKDILFYIFFVWQLGLSLDNPAEDAVAEIGIHVLRAGIKVQGLFQHKPDYIITNDGWFCSGMCRHTPWNEHGIVARFAVPTTRMMQQLANRNFIHPGIENLTT